MEFIPLEDSLEQEGGSSRLNESAVKVGTQHNYRSPKTRRAKAGSLAKLARQWNATREKSANPEPNGSRDCGKSDHWNFNHAAFFNVGATI
jgi:hypothetical protein